MSEQNIVNTIVVPEVPKVIPGEQLYVYVPRATFTSPGIIAYDKTQFNISGDVLSIKDDYIEDVMKAPMSLKQDKTDESISLSQFQSQKTVVGAINDIGGQTAANSDNIAENTANISDLQSRIQAIENTKASAETPIGQMSGTALPTNAQLTAFTVSKVDRQPRPNDSIIFILLIAGKTDENYKYIYYDENTQWQGFEIPPIEQASNGSLGTIKGTYATDSTNNVLVDIAAGEIKGIYYKGNDGTYQNIRTKINLMDVLQTNIVNGTQVVGIATKALQDQLGNVINLTYAMKSEVYTKAESDSKYLPSTYTDIYYYSTNGLINSIPTTPESGIQFTKVVNAIGAANIFSASRALEGNYNFTKNSTDTSVIWVSVDSDCTVEFRLSTYVQKSGQQARLLSAELTGEISLKANTPTQIPIPAIYSALGSEKLQASAGDIFRKDFDVITTDSATKTFNVYSNAVYPSTFNLATQSIVFDINTISGLKTIEIANNEWSANDDGTYSVIIPRTRHEQAPSANYVLELQEMIAAGTYERIAFSAKVDTDGNITLTAYEPLTCELLIGSSVSSEERGILTLTNPTTAPKINFSQYGAIEIVQTATATEWNLPAPTNTRTYYTCFVYNSVTSTQNALVNGKTLNPGKGLLFHWVGATWVTGE